MAIIYLNPGHGSPDPGAIGRTGLQEAAVAAVVGDCAAWYLQKVGHEVHLWQNDDINAVCAHANSVDADLFVSIHCNSVERIDADGTETFSYPGSKNSRILAECVQNQMIGEFGLYNRGLKTATWAVLRDTNMPSCLAEMAFISNPEEEQLLATQQDRWGACIARGITDYCLKMGI